MEGVGRVRRKKEWVGKTGKELGESEKKERMGRKERGKEGGRELGESEKKERMGKKEK